MNITKFALVALAFDLSGCAHSGGPLVFVVTHTVGVDIQAASTSSATPGLTVGYKSADIAIVPTQLSTDGGDPLRGCYSVGQNGASTPSICDDSGPGMPDGNSQTKAEWRTRHALQRVTAKSDSIDVNSGLLRTVIAPPAAAPPQGQARGGQFGEAVEDAYSVYASFGTGSKASNSGPSVDIGEVFATGDAAVQLAEGINYYSSRAGNAAMVNAVSTCIQQVSAAKAAGVDMSKIPSCDTTELASASNPAPTLTAISPTSANGPAARAAAVTVTVTLSGGGFGQTSKLNIMGN